MDHSNDRLIGALVADLRPVRPLLPPALRALIWLMFVAAVAVAIAMFADVGAVSRRMTAIPDMWLAVFGSVATMATAAFAAFELSLPDRSRAWAFLPLPALALWVGASGLGCMRAYVLPGTHVAGIGEMRDCLLFIIGLSVPLSAALIIMLRRAYSLAPPAHGSNGGPRFGRGGGHVAEFLPSFRRRAGRPCRPCGCGADRRRGSATSRQADPAKFFRAPVTVPTAGSN
jgi:hypothetical protein